MKSYVKKLSCALAVCMFVLFAAVTFRPVAVQAATKNVKELDYVIKLKTIKKKATKIKKGTTTLKGTKGGFKFTSKKTKKYTFTFSNVKAPESKYNNAYGHVYAEYQKRNYLRSKYLSTQGGKSYSLYLTTQTNYDSGSKSRVNAYTSLPTRSTTFKVKKGQTIYFYFSFAGGPVFFNVSIK